MCKVGHVFVTLSPGMRCEPMVLGTVDVYLVGQSVLQVKMISTYINLFQPWSYFSNKFFPSFGGWCDNIHTYLLSFNHTLPYPVRITYQPPNPNSPQFTFLMQVIAANFLIFFNVLSYNSQTHSSPLTHINLQEKSFVLKHVYIPFFLQRLVGVQLSLFLFHLHPEYKLGAWKLRSVDAVLQSTLQRSFLMINHQEFLRNSKLEF